VLGIVLFVTCIVVTALFIWHGRHATAFNCCLRHHHSDSTMTSNNATSPISLPTSGSFTHPKHNMAIGNNYVSSSYDRPRLASVNVKSRDASGPLLGPSMASHAHTNASSSGGAPSRSLRLTDSRSRHRSSGDTNRRRPYPRRSSSRDRSRRVRRVRPMEVTSGRAVTSDSCVNLAISHVIGPGNDTGLCTIEVFVSGDYAPYRAGNSQC